MSTHEDIRVVTRSGSKVHVGSPGSSVTACGVWLRADARHFETERAVTCVKCLAHVCETCGGTGDIEEPGFPPGPCADCMPADEFDALVGNRWKDER